MAQRRTALVLPVPVPAGLARLRRTHDPVARLGVPPHLTLLFPFVPAEALTPAVRADVASALAAVPPMRVRFAEARTWPGVAWLAPEPPGPLRSLIDALAERFPETPPYGGAFDEVVPHLTLAEDAAADVASIAVAARAWLPFTATLGRVALLAESEDGRWRERWRFRLRLRP